MLFLFVLENMSYFTPLRIEQVKGGCYAADRVRWHQRLRQDRRDGCACSASAATSAVFAVLGRQTLGSSDAPEIDLLFCDGNRRLQNGTWSAIAPKISIFDGVFVAANVHSGDVVDAAHRRNLYRVIVGAEGVGLAEQEQALAEEARAKQSDLTTAERAVQSLVP